jgi:tetratricopeptide (TPR) repeat protein
VAGFVDDNNSKECITLPTGDGVALAFARDITAPLRYAREFAMMLRRGATFQVRMGIHTGPVYWVADINANQNVAGGGINIAQRVMDCGDAGHILVTREAAENLVQISLSWKEILHDLGQVEVKHGLMLQVFSAYDQNYGNPALPQKISDFRKNSAQARQPRRGRLGWLRSLWATADIPLKPVVRENSFVPAEFYTSALTSREEADSYEDIKEFLDEADRLANQGFALDADVLYLKCLSEYKHPAVFNHYGTFLLRCNHLPQAEMMFHKVDELAVKAGEKWRSIASINLGVICRMRLDLPGAERYYMQALKIDRGLNRGRGVATSLGNLGVIAQIRGLLDLAEERFREALQLASASQWIGIMAAQHGNLGRLYLKREQLDQAVVSLRAALDLELRLGRRDAIADASSSLGLAYRDIGNLDQAEALLREALAINEGLERATAVTDQYADLGIVQLKNGHLDEAEKLLEIALQRSYRSSSTVATAHVRAYQGLLFQDQGNLDEAEQSHRFALASYERMQLLDFQADQLSHLGSVYEAKGYNERAIECWKEAAAIYTRIQQPQRVKLLQSWAIELTET